MSDLIRVTPSGLAVNYAPDYLAKDLGFFEAQGLDVDSSIYAGPGSSWLSDHLVAGRADIALGGIWIPLAYRGLISELSIFGMVCARNPQVIVSRKPIADFAWEDLYGKKLVLPLESTSQWMFLQGAMLEAGADVSRMELIRDLHVETTTNMWRAGFGDFYLTTPPLTESLEEEGYFVATTSAESCGPVPWSVYYATPDFLAREDNAAGRYLAAVQNAFGWIHDHQPSEIAEALKPRFPDMDLGLLSRAVFNLRDRGVWAERVTVPEDSFMRYQGMIADYGLIDAPYPFDSVVDKKPARFATGDA